MPTWLVHGFRWPRPAIRIHTIIQNLDDVAPEWLMAPSTTDALLENFNKLHPQMMIHLPGLRFVEQHDPVDLKTTSQPYAYICDQVHEVTLGVDIDEVRGLGVKNEVWSAMADLRDQVAPGEKVAWFVVVNGDVERWVPPEDGDEEATETGVGSGSLDESATSPISPRSSVGRIEEEGEDSDQTERPPKGFKKWFGGKARRTKRDLRSDSMMGSRRDFLSMPAPENYVAGLGRGATGFTTRSDLGPAREGPSEDQMKEMLAKRAATLGQAAPSAYGVVEKKDTEEDDEADRFADPDNEVGLFSNGMNYDKDDDEADRIFQSIDDRLDKRRKVRREAREQAERDEHERNNPKIQLMFAPLKRALASVTEDEWAALPDASDATHKAKRAREARLSQRSYAVPDSVLNAAAQTGQLETSISSDGDGTMTNFASIGAAQKSALQVRLDSAASSNPGTQTAVSGTSTSIDPKGYITALDKASAAGQALPIEDVKRARILLEAAVKSNETNGPSYVALARLEEMAGKLSTAKRILERGALKNPKSIVVWTESIRINSENIHNAKIIAAQALNHNPKSVQLWLSAVELEQTSRDKKKVLRLALDRNGTSVELWKALINETEDIQDVRNLFAAAVEHVRLSEELWLSYARVCEPEHAQMVLNSARKAIPTSSQIWIQASRLQEQLGKPDLCAKIIERAVKSLIKENAMPKREDWISQAEVCEEEGCPATAGAIIRAAIGWSLDEDDERRAIWLQDCKDSQARGRFETARAIIAHTANIFVYSTTVWHAWIDLEKHHGTQETLFNVFERAVNSTPQAETIWLGFARELWQANKFEEARTVVGRSFQSMPGNENLYTTAVALEVDAGQYDAARNLLAIARDSAPSDRIFMKSATLERQLGELEAAIDFCTDGLRTWPGSWKLHAIKGQIYEQIGGGKLKEAQECLTIGTRACPNAPVLYILLSRLQEKNRAFVQARSTLDRAKQQNPKNPLLLCEAVRLERRQGNIPAAQKLLAAALQEVPTSGLLWTEKIMHLEARTQRKPRALEAIKKVENDPQLFAVVGRIFWSERRLDKASTWFVKAISLDPDYGDAWIYYWKFLEQHGTDAKREEILSRIIMAEPKHGEIWQSVAKDPKNARKGVEEILKIAVRLAE
ncbi:pre-mRNA-splicing factor prp1 [Pleomassaria siparia CBS 279.74]|uniref:Pre-mRNA-splicing factor prp1 n=1 Tax=Pleomassaria siparia CBS 279.74 TaxID=1314801 RepID=A0A6G1KEP4_9PLEO|nr:pre-mRNA-splicing factor prp1 [Pleomassaria siparia CBS 279.74]